MSNPPLKLDQLTAWLLRLVRAVPVICNRPPLKVIGVSAPPRLASLLMLTLPATRTVPPV